MKLIRRCVSFSLVTWLAFVSVPARAGEGVEKTLAEQIEALRRRLEQQQAEIDHLRAEQQKLLEKLAGPEATLAPPVSASLPPSVEQRAETNQKTDGRSTAPWLKSDRLHIGGYGSLRFEANNVGGSQFVPGG